MKQDESLIKAKIMSLRIKRPISRDEKLFRAVDSLIPGCDSQHECLQHKFDQFMQIENRGQVFQLKHTKRQIGTDYTINHDTVDSWGNLSSNVNVIFTQVKQKLPRLQVTDNGELILLDVTERHQVCIHHYSDY